MLCSAGDVTAAMQLAAVHDGGETCVAKMGGPNMRQRSKLCRMAAVGARYAATEEAVQDGSSRGQICGNREAGEDGSNGN